MQHFSTTSTNTASPLTTENRAAAFALFRYDPQPRLRLTANLRQAPCPRPTPSRPPPAWNGTCWPGPAPADDSLAHARTHQLTFKASAARSYRAPTLNERSVGPGGNPGLRPEIGPGLRGRPAPPHWLAPPHHAAKPSSPAYRQLVDDWVQWTPGAAGFWSRATCARCSRQGLEASTALRLAPGPLHRRRAGWPTHFTQARKTHRATPADPVTRGPAAALRAPPHRHLRHRTTPGAPGAGRRRSATSYRYIDASGTDFLPGYGLLGG